MLIFSKRRRKTKQTYSKRVTSIILGVALFDIQLTYVLAFLGMTDTAETLSITLVTEVIGVFAVYSVKAYLGKRNEEENKLKKKELDVSKESDTSTLD